MRSMNLNNQKIRDYENLSWGAAAYTLTLVAPLDYTRERETEDS